MGEAVLNAPAAAYDVRALYLRCLPEWADMYVEGYWSLAQFEAHADAMREAVLKEVPGEHAGRR